MLTKAIEAAIAKSGLTDSQWATENGFSGSTLHDIKKKGTASGRNLAKLQRAGVEIANKKLIASLDAA